MSLRSRLSATAETVQEFEIALREKYQEGQGLIAGGNNGAGIYLLGYSAEMLLKNAYFRLTGAIITDEVEARLSPTRKAGKVALEGISDESYHSLRFWAMLLQHERTFQGLLPLPFEQEFELRTERLYSNWWVEMRYRHDLSFIADAIDVVDDVGWLLNNYVALWTS